MGTSRRIIIIGAGVGGAACAALLAKKGDDILVFERNAFVGGKCAALSSRGYTYDMGVHMSIRGPKGPHGQVARKVGADLTFLQQDPFMRLIIGDREHMLPLDIKPLRAQLQLARKIGVKITSLPNIYRMIRHLSAMGSLENAEAFDTMPLIDYVNKFTRDPQIHLFFNLFSGLFLALPYNLASTGEFGYCFATFLKDGSWGYPKGGFKEIAASFLRAAERDGAGVRLNEPIKKILVKDGQAVGVETDQGVYEADIVISNAGIKKTLEFAGMENFSEDYRKIILAMENSYTGITVKFGLKEKFVSDYCVLYTPAQALTIAFLEGLEKGNRPADVPLFIPVPSNLDPSLAPAGKQLLIAGTMGPPHLSMARAADKELEEAEKTIERIFPGIGRRIEWKMRTDLNTVNSLSGRDSADIAGLAQNYYQCGRKRPKAALPVANLYQVGSDAGGRGVGTEMAVDSAMRLSEYLCQT